MDAPRSVELDSAASCRSLTRLGSGRCPEAERLGRSSPGGILDAIRIGCCAEPCYDRMLYHKLRRVSSFFAARRCQTGPGGKHVWPSLPCHDVAEQRCRSKAQLNVRITCTPRSVQRGFRTLAHTAPTAIVVSVVQQHLSELSQRANSQQSGSSRSRCSYSTSATRIC